VARAVVTTYDLGCCNTESRFEIPDRRGAGAAGMAHAVLLRPPGTGKTALAEHIAQQCSAR
jgi:SpoVK/Ycf46/Vps4 family AAA+-type ATPase